MPSFGLQPTGFVVKPLSAILSDIQTSMLSLISASLDMQPTALMGIISGIMAGAISEVWQLTAAIYNGMAPDGATDDQLTNVALITGTPRLPATATVVQACTVNVNAGFHAEPGMMFATVVGNPLNQFFNLEVVDSVGGGNVTGIDFACQDTGPIQSLSGTLTVIAQALTGWNSITNPTDGIPGSNIETDSDLRTRRTAELSSGGSSTANAIAGAVLIKMQPSATPPTSVPTTAVTVLHNDTDATDSNGLPPHSLEVIARSPGATSNDDLLLATLISNEKTAGDGTHGTSSKVVIDSQGNSDVINFTRPVDVPLTVLITVLTDPAKWPGNTPGIASIKASMVAFALVNYQPGVEVFVKKLADQAFATAGVLDWTVMTVNGGGNLPIDIRHVATLSTGGITVTVT